MFTFDRNMDIRLNILSEKDAYMTSYVGMTRSHDKSKVISKYWKTFLLLVTFRNHNKDLVSVGYKCSTRRDDLGLQIW